MSLLCTILFGMYVTQIQSNDVTKIITSLNKTFPSFMVGEYISMISF